MDAKVVFSMVGKFFISAACIGVFMFTPECYPTTVRLECVVVKEGVREAGLMSGG